MCRRCWLCRCMAHVRKQWRELPQPATSDAAGLTTAGCEIKQKSHARQRKRETQRQSFHLNTHCQHWSSEIVQHAHVPPPLGQGSGFKRPRSSVVSAKARSMPARSFAAAVMASSRAVSVSASVHSGVSATDATKHRRHSLHCKNVQLWRPQLPNYICDLRGAPRSYRHCHQQQALLPA